MVRVSVTGRVVNAVTFYVRVKKLSLAFELL